MNREKNNIILIGFMGSGKTSLGKWISKNVNMQLYDTDEYIEKKTGISVKDIFEKYGEEYFRTLESSVIIEMNQSIRNSVISVGGGLPLKQENREVLKEMGLVVYLRATKETLKKRLSGDNKRPLLMGCDIESKIKELIEKREKIYLDTSDLVVDTDERSFEQIYNELENNGVGSR